jgi:uncharacterized protein (DUF1330 family)
MAAYVIFIREKTYDPSELETYSKMTPAGLEGHSVTFRALYGHHEVVEGPEVEGVAILEFPSFEEAKAWYNNPASLLKVGSQNNIECKVVDISNGDCVNFLSTTYYESSTQSSLDPWSTAASHCAMNVQRSPGSSGCQHPIAASDIEPCGT